MTRSYRRILKIIELLRRSINSLVRWVQAICVYVWCGIKSGPGMWLLSGLSKIFGATLIAVLSFYAVSILEHSYQIEVRPNLEGKYSLSEWDKIFEVRFRVYNRGWTDRNLTGIELPEKPKGPMSLMELKDNSYPVVLPKQSHTEIVLDKLSSYNLLYADLPIVMYFDRHKIEVPREDVIREISFSRKIGNKTYTADGHDLFNAIVLLSELDRIFKLNTQACEGDIEYLSNERDLQANRLSKSKFIVKTGEEILGTTFQTAAYSLMSLDLLKMVEDDLYVLSENEYKEFSSGFARLYWIDRMIAAGRCKSQLMLYDKYYSTYRSIYAQKAKVGE
ncbi:MAG: hypothetical protein JNM24_17965 [Bdellovibrionaceae bacterium]|nr:hypothetical protein [Pseudobdellovibrionaceae bacterium]